MGGDPATAVAQIAARVLTLIDTQDGTELVTTIAGGMLPGDYLPTRTFELAVHTADLATALGVPPYVPATAAMQALAIVADLAITDGMAGRFCWPPPAGRACQRASRYCDTTPGNPAPTGPGGCPPIQPRTRYLVLYPRNKPSA